MIRSRALGERNSPYICVACRRQLQTWHAGLRSNTPITSNRQSLSQRPTAGLARPGWSSRTFSTTKLVLEDSSNGKPSSTEKPPSGFPAGFAAASLGLFAKKHGGQSSVENGNDGLLPHDHEALTSRQASAPPPRQPSTPASQNDQSRRGGKKPQKRPSGSIADMLKRNSSPPPPAIELPSQPGRGEFSLRSSAEIKSQGIGHQRISKKHENNGNRLSDWGSFSDRAAKTDTAPKFRVKKGTDPSSAWQQMKMGRVSESTKQPATEKKEDFWAEFDKRAGERTASRFGRGAGAASQKRNGRQDTQREEKKPNDIPQEQRPSNSTAAPPRERVTPNARSSRFEVESNDQRNIGEKREKDKRSRRDNRVGRAFVEEDESTENRWDRKQQKKAVKEKARQEQAGGQREAIPIFLPEYISASSLATSLKQSQDYFLRDMVDMGFENVTGDTLMTGETAALIAMEYGFDPTVDDGAKRDLRPRPIPTDPTLIPQRPPVVTIMGHVDHGKTTLLDYLRKSSIAAQEHGGITQHIGAFVVKMSSGKPITFLDTPGHAAFLSMRQRGAIVTDIVVLVVAADDSVKPQTVEAIKHARTAKVPIIVAINKIDKGDARIQQVKSDLVRNGVEIEDYGGDVQVVLVSGKTGRGMDDLEENIITLSEILDSRAEPDGMAEGWVLESSVKIDGKVATVLVKRGTLRTGDIIVAGKSMARVRLLRNEAGAEISEAPPGTPVEVFGWRELPEAGEQILQAPDEDAARSAVEYRTEMAERQESGRQLAEQEKKQREKAAQASAALEAEKAGEVYEQADSSILYQNFVVKADVAGSVEAVVGSILELGNNEVQSKVLRSSAGQISEYDVDHAAASSSIIVNFNNPINPQIKQRADEAKVRIMDYNVIYHLVDDAKSALSNLLPPTMTHRVTGEADILQIFPINIRGKKYKNIAGCRVRNGNVKKTSKVKVLRKGKVVYDGDIDTLKHVKKDVQEMGKGTECGVGFEKFEGFEIDDQIQCYEIQEEKRTL